MNVDSIKELSFSRLDNSLGKFLVQRTMLAGHQKSRFEQVVAKLSYELSNGHSCVTVDDEEISLLRQASGLVSTSERTPLILENNRLYFYRYWCYEKRLSEQVLRLTKQSKIWPDLEPLLARYFPESTVTKDWQRAAVQNVLGQSFSIITGGPGTGKTTTVIKLLAVLLELSEQTLHIGLVAPTGKAAMRLQQAMVQNKQDLPCSDLVKQGIPELVTTIHRLLGARPPSPYFVHDAENPLPHDLIVVDEASMVDLALMSKLVNALNDNSRIILLGDKDQLASVEAGAVLADMTMALPSHTHVLKTAYRFNSNIKALADAVNRQDIELAWALLGEQQQDDVGLLDTVLIDYINTQLQCYWQLVDSGAEFKEIINCFNQFQVLCVNRRGRNSVSNINNLVESSLQEIVHTRVEPWYLGRPVMISQNYPAMQLYNGDIGICLADPEQENRLMVFIEQADGSVKKFLPSRLPSCETVFAMTIHKSQGSEFDEVLIVLPDTMSPILSKELIYTAITRARKRVKLFSAKDVFAKALQQKVARIGGLEQRLKNII